MADLQTSSNPQIALVLQALEDLVLRFDEHVQQQEGEKKLGLTQEDRDCKTQLLDELHWNLLPAIQKQLSFLSTSLDLLHDPEKISDPKLRTNRRDPITPGRGNVCIVRLCRVRCSRHSTNSYTRSSLGTL
ncbi:hypothetical protein KEM48_008221 [Puccinia striiformis f. sp. tritici PST-130]|nr:hypothetical protein KEM48_008221 [Puccinia striiformis f. sp. tritici PST-130]